MSSPSFVSNSRGLIAKSAIGLAAKKTAAHEHQNVLTHVAPKLQCGLLQCVTKAPAALWPHKALLLCASCTVAAKKPDALRQEHGLLHHSCKKACSTVNKKGAVRWQRNDPATLLQQQGLLHCSGFKAHCTMAAESMLHHGSKTKPAALWQQKACHNVAAQKNSCSVAATRPAKLWEHIKAYCPVAATTPIGVLYCVVPALNEEE